mmetsp:Transcript_113501/g.225923  ORF Transcript_113501/g.225923 Transcript_113501/m.225923 type:complete len:83 (-) Transcript_113501:266-514(-)
MVVSLASLQPYFSLAGLWVTPWLGICLKYCMFSNKTSQRHVPLLRANHQQPDCNTSVIAPVRDAHSMPQHGVSQGSTAVRPT